MTVAIKNAHFISPVKVGAAVSCYAEVIKTGKASVQIMLRIGLLTLVLLISLLRWRTGCSCSLRLMSKVS
jgi:acyl dehydratase